MQSRVDALSPVERARADRIVRENEGLVRWAVKRFARLAPNHELEEIAQEFRVILWRCSFTWDPYKGALSTYAVVMMRRRALQMDEKFKPHGIRRTPDKAWRALSLEWVSEGFDLVEQIPGTDDIAAFHDEVSAAAMIAHLPERERSMILDKIAGLTLQEISVKHGITRERVRQVIKAAGAKIDNTPP